ncbi:MAG TPA: PAS domain S-box protein [Thermoanaerobaculia bacterium]|jgi:PAS domain S-box-containing protein|nr:PAS domain S-box protein [Thermoanaerobaculia bacterium]
MTFRPESNQEARSRHLIWSAGLLVLLAAAMIVAGWVFEISLLTEVTVLSLVVLSFVLVLLMRESATRRKVQEDLSESELRFRSTLDNLLEGCQIIDRDWRYVYVNPTAARQGGRTVDELVGRTMEESYPGIEQTPMFVVLRRCMKTWTAETFDNEFALLDGTVGWFRLMIQPIPEGVFILSLDITEKVRAEAALRENEARFNAFMDATPTIAWMKDASGRYLYLNRAWGDTFGLDPRTSIGTTDADLAPPAAASMIARTEGGMLRSEDVVEPTEKNPRSWNSIRFPFKSLSGEKFVGGIAIDITRRLQAEAALRDAEAELHVVIDNLSQGVVITDLAGNYRHWNPAALAILGFSGSDDWREAMSQFSEIFEVSTLEGTSIPSDDWPMRRIRRGEPVKNLEVRVSRRDIDWERVFSYTGQIVHYSGGKTLAFITITDVTERHLVEA